MAKEYGMWPLNVCQIGKEVTWNTPVACTTIWRGPFGGWNDERESEDIAEDVGTFAFTERTVDTFLDYRIPFPSAVAHFEQLLYLLEASVGKATPTGGGVPYTWPYVASLADTPPTLQPYTMRIGNKKVSADVALFAGCLPVEWELSGNQKESYKLSGTHMSPRKQSGSFSAGLSLPAQTPMVFGRSKLYIDASGGTIGSTQKTGVLMGFSLKYNPQIEWVPVGDGNLYAGAYKMGKPIITFTLTLELEQDTGVSTVAAERTAFENKSTRLIRILIDESANHKAQFDFAGEYTSVGEYQKSGNSNTTVQFEGKVLYSAADTLFFESDITVPINTLP